MDIIHHIAFYVKHAVSCTEFRLRLQVALLSWVQ
jgi:hypothetical protein